MDKKVDDGGNGRGLRQIKTDLKLLSILSLDIHLYLWYRYWYGERGEFG
jgi:hypothetical protein